MFYSTIKAPAYEIINDKIYDSKPIKGHVISDFGHTFIIYNFFISLVYILAFEIKVKVSSFEHVVY